MGIMNDRFPAPLVTPRLLLRRLERSDAAALAGYRSLPEVARHQSWTSFGLEDATRLIKSQRRTQPGVPGTWFQLAIVEKATSILAGDCGLHCAQAEPFQVEIGITLAPAHQRRGYATEALECVLDFVFTTLEMHRVSAVTAAENAAAAALFRRLSFRQEAHLLEHRWFKGRWESEFVFGLLRREWDARDALSAQ
jgi:RimJ/RimL family protein N-acetyltransferase